MKMNQQNMKEGPRIQKTPGVGSEGPEQIGAFLGHFSVSSSAPHSALGVEQGGTCWTCHALRI